MAGHSKDATNYDFSLARYHSEEGGYIIDQDKTFQSVSLYPNPVLAGNSINLEYTLMEDEDLSIELLSISGKLLEVLSEKQNRKAGLHKENFILSGDLSSGIYFVRLTSSQGSAVVRLEIN
ncbi:MAG: T9SS type A sorting domain-containing protein [Bacteroidetes bacterium]|nr:T9SS type A sorting domain-containing protein [Bacteroidota bacterium]